MKQQTHQLCSRKVEYILEHLLHRCLQFCHEVRLAQVIQYCRYFPPDQSLQSDHAHQAFLQAQVGQCDLDFPEKKISDKGLFQRKH